MNSFSRELKQRKVYRVALGYAVVAWLVIQIGATVMPAYHAPEWILPTFIAAVALGFPVALVLAWAFESHRDNGRGFVAVASANRSIAWCNARMAARGSHR